MKVKRFLLYGRGVSRETLSSLYNSHQNVMLVT